MTTILRVRLETSGQVEEYEFRHESAPLSAATLRRLASRIEAQIRDRTALGVDVEGRAFKPYSPKGKKAGEKVTLETTGDMMAAMTSTVNPGRAEVCLHFDAPPSAFRAYIHNTAGAGKAQIIRRFFGLSKADIEGLVTEASRANTQVEKRRWGREE